MLVNEGKSKLKLNYFNYLQLGECKKLTFLHTITVIIKD